ncbi:MAG: AAA family ATPase, partial [Bdellovibrionales bacterium]
MRNQIEVAAREKFGEPNTRLSSKNELRFGSQGSKSVELTGDAAGSWYDFETEEGGHLGAAEEVVAPSVRLIVQKYDYHDAAGKLVMQVCRYMPKEFRQRRPDGNGNWIWSVKDIEPVPYRLPEILSADEVVIVEGEKDADTLMAAGIVATTKSGGSGRWPDAMSKYFAGKRVYVLPDNDEAGRKTGLNTAAALSGVADHVAFCDVFAGLRAKADASDWLEEGGDPAELIERLRQFPAFEEDEALEGLDIFPTIDADGMAPALSADDFVEGLLISTQMSVVYGPSNSGKTFFAADLALHVALGWNWRGLEVDQGGVIYIAAEGSYGIQNRVAAFKQAHEIDETVPFSV